SSFCQCYGRPRDLHSFPTRRSSDLKRTNMAAIDAIGIEARRVLLEVMMSVAWADREIAPEERQAARAAAMSLGLVMPGDTDLTRSEEHTSELQSRENLVCRLLLEKK